MNRHNPKTTPTIYDQLTFSTSSGENGTRRWEVTRQGTILVGEVYYARQNQEVTPGQSPTETEYRPLVKHVVYRHGGILASRPDGQFSAFFPDTRKRHQEAPRAIRCALTIAEELSRLNDHRRQLDAPPLRIGLGVDVGAVQIRTTTQGHWLKGEPADTAVYLSELNKQTPFHTVFISDAVRETLPDLYDWHLEHLGVVTPEYHRRLQVYAVMRTPDLLTENGL